MTAAPLAAPETGPVPQRNQGVIATSTTKGSPPTHGHEHEQLERLAAREAIAHESLDPGLRNGYAGERPSGREGRGD